MIVFASADSQHTHPAEPDTFLVTSLERTGDLAVMMQNAISQHSGLGQAQLEDPFLSSFAQQEVENILGIAVGNQKTSGYTVGEIYGENNAFTKKVSFLLPVA